MLTYDVEMVLSDDGPWVLKSAAEKDIRYQKYQRCRARADACFDKSRWYETVWYQTRDNEADTNSSYYRWHIKWFHRGCKWNNLSKTFKEE